MIRARSLSILLAVVAVATAAVASAQSPDEALRADYEFQGTLTSSVGSVPALRNLGDGNAYQEESVGGVQRTVLAFPEGNGLALAAASSIIPTSEYTIDILLRFETVSGYRRIVDFSNATGDIGLYDYNGSLNFYPSVTGTDRGFIENRWVQVTLTRDAAGNVVGYLNGLRQISFQDTEDRAVISQADVLRFFRDDNAIGGEQSAGAVARIRLYDRPLSAVEVAGLTLLP